MEDTEKSKIFGKKIFFINPTTKIEKYIVQELRNMEYEAYSISDYKCAKAILKENSDAICFVYLDSGLTYTQWYKFVKTFEYDDSLKHIFIGLLSDKISEKKKDFFLMNANLPGGFTMTNIPMEELFPKIQKILDVNEAKGKRQYIRLICKKLSQISAYIRVSGKLFPLELLDISSVGFAVNMTSALSGVFVQKTAVNNISLTINKETFNITGVVLMSKISGDMMNSVLFIKSPDETLVKTIKSLIFSVLDENMSNDMKFCLKDETDYASLDLKDFESYGSISDTDDSDDIEEAESVEEI